MIQKLSPQVQKIVDLYHPADFEIQAGLVEMHIDQFPQLQLIRLANYYIIQYVPTIKEPVPKSALGYSLFLTESLPTPTDTSKPITFIKHNPDEKISSFTRLPFTIIWELSFATGITGDPVIYFHPAIQPTKFTQDIMSDLQISLLELSSHINPGLTTITVKLPYKDRLCSWRGNGRYGGEFNFIYRKSEEENFLFSELLKIGS